MAPMSVPATLAPPAPPKASPTARSSARRAPAADAASVAASSVAGSAALLTLTPAAPAAALSKEDVAGSLIKVVDTVDDVIGVGGKAAEQVAAVLKALGEAVQPAFPVLKSASDEALKLAAPVVSGASKQATEALQGAGVDPAPVLSVAKTAAEQSTKVIDAAKPVASATVETITTLGPEGYVVTAGAALLAYLLVPPVWSLVSFSLRGYKGDLTPAQALDKVTTQDYVLIDVRSDKDKAKAGVPQLPSNAKNQLVSVPLEDLPSKLKGMVRNAKKAEAEIAALKISYLKKIGKGSNVIIMDSSLQRRLQDCGEDAEQRRVQELLGHGRRLLGSERVGAEPPWDGLVQPVRGGSRDAVAGDPGSRRPHWDDLCTHSVPSNYSQASSRQRRLMSGAETTFKV
ncbi:calcium sensing receptor, chloroplastic isoform X1 [Sorghum bicolor]|uniref:calcium sensing receptor, chloroplastic isoform X1 n=1 Tax=Sorghum bicolor TaxID=4558 RepID=UPI000B424592|nr:calcium sensing receptor, chloroplastic isoform X1 [Sorghum bicolor]|eukprot:XP_021314057.1 calcium sensing receptor, chloroplastic isoform X1 [Sorghum bicolor]